jgi:ribosomal protein S18 acetylase RimI-like enzyme
MISISRLQAYLRYSAQRQYEPLALPHFTLFFHSTDKLTFFNYAIPLMSDNPNIDVSLSTLRNEFAKRDRVPRFEFMEEYAPQLPEILRKAGFKEEARQQFMICRPETYKPTPELPGLEIIECSRRSPLNEIQDFLSTQKRGFNPQEAETTDLAEAEQFSRMMGDGQIFLAQRAGQTVGVGMFTAPFDRISELVGLATLAPFRKRGIGSALCVRAVKRAMEKGVEVVCLTAADERAGRIYEQVGFRKHATMLAFIDSAFHY